MKKTRKKSPFGRPRRRPGAGIRPSPEAVASRLGQAGIELTSRQLGQLWQFHEMLRKRNHDQELTRLIGFQTIVDKHYVDSLIVGDLVDLPSPLLDLGTGAGFPGIPLKIRYPDVEIILGEPRPKRVEFMENVIRKVGLRQVSVFPHKVSSNSFTTPVRGVITRAVETMDKTLLRTSGSLEVGGRIVFMKGPNCDEEIRQIKRDFGAHFKLLQNQPYQLPGTPHRRRLVVWERLTDVPLKRR